MNLSQFEPLKCDSCGKTLGYIHISVKIFPPERWIRLVAGGPTKQIRKTAFCEKCFLKEQKQKNM